MSTLPGPDFDENLVGLAEELGEAVGETHRLANVARPIGRIGRFLGLDPRAADIGEIRDARRAEARCSQPLFECARESGPSSRSGTHAT